MKLHLCEYVIHQRNQKCKKVITLTGGFHSTAPLASSGKMESCHLQIPVVAASCAGLDLCDPDHGSCPCWSCVDDVSTSTTQQNLKFKTIWNKNVCFHSKSKTRSKHTHIYIYGSFSETVYQYCDIGTKKSKCFKTPNM